MKKARRHAYLALFAIILLLTCSCKSIQSFEAGVKTPSWFPLELILKFDMKADAKVGLPDEDEEEAEVAEGMSE